MTDAGAPAVEVVDLRVELTSGKDIVDEVSFAIAPGEVLGLVGESGSGKTTVGLSLLGHTRRGASVAHGRVVIGAVDLLALDEAQLRATRGRVVSYVPQDPSTALNPSIRIGSQLEEMLTEHARGDAGGERQARVREVLGEVALTHDDAFLSLYPHQLSGGQQQRIALAMAFACRPRVIVLDEPTTGLDVTTQAHVLATVRELCRRHEVAALYISHDLAVVSSLADRVAVMYAGRLVELGPRETLFARPAHPYTHGLIRAIPDIATKETLEGIPGRPLPPGARPQGCFFEPRCAWAVERCREQFPPAFEVGGLWARCWRAEEVHASPPSARTALDTTTRIREGASLLSVRDVSASYGTRQVLHDVSLDVFPGECLALVGESGSGKTTLARCIAGLIGDYQGEIALDGEPLARTARARPPQTRKRIQYIFQSPYSALNPRWTIGEIVAQPLRVVSDLPRAERVRRVGAMLERVALSARLTERYPDQLSGGERQRVAIARALVTDPDLLVCDEITSALDVSVQATIVELIGELQREMNVGMLFVTHNLALVRTIASEVAVMKEGRIVEHAAADAVLGTPSDAYTRQLLDNTLSLERTAAVIE